MNKKCSKCGIAKPLDKFAKERRSKDGHRYACKECERSRMRDYLEGLGPEGRAKRVKRARERRRANPQRDREYQTQYRERHAAKNLIRHARRRAQRAVLPFDLNKHEAEIQARIDTGRCEMTGMPLSTVGGRKFNSPSLDRIKPSKGYVLSNVRVVCLLMNCALGDWGEDILATAMGRWLETRR